MPDEFERPGRDLETVSDVQAEGTGAREKARAASRDLLDRAVEKKDELKQRASTLADERRTGVVERGSSISRALHGAADSLRENGEPQLSDWVHQAAGQVEKVVSYLEGKRADGMAGDLENLARSNPALFLGGTYLAGLALGRFLRATSPEHRQERSLRDTEDLSEADERGYEPAIGEGAPSMSGNLGSTGWSGVGVAPGAFGGTPVREQTPPSRGRSTAGEGSASGEAMRGSGSGSTDVFGRAVPDAGEARRDFRTTGSSGFGKSGLGSNAVGSSSAPGMNSPASDLGGGTGSHMGPGAGATDSPDMGEGPEVQTDRDLHEAPPRADRTEQGMRAEESTRGGWSMSSEPDRDEMRSLERERGESMRGRERDRDREV